MHTPKRKILALLAVLAVASLLVLFFANPRTISSPSRAAVSDSVHGGLVTIHGIAESVRRIMPFASFRQEIARLRREIDTLKREKIESSQLVAENHRLKEMLAFRKAIPFTTIPSEVIGRDASNWSNSIIIDKGALQGVRQNMAVLSARGLVGRILEVGRYSSKALLITDPNSKVGVIIQRNRQGGMLIGRGDGTCKMIYIALDSDVAKGDKVITSGLSAIFPRGILAGEVTEVGRESGRLYKYAVVSPAQDMSKLEEVLCVK